MMNKILTMVAAALTFFPLQVKSQTEMELTQRQQAIVVMAAFEAQGKIEELKTILNEGFEAGLTISEAKEVLSQLYAYTGFPRSLNALGALQQVIRERAEAGLKTEEGREADPLPEGYDALAAGTEIQARLVGQAFTYDFAPQTDYYLKAHLFGDIFARNNLSFAERELATIGAISVLPGCEAQLRFHIGGSRNLGVSDAQLHDIPAVLRGKVGEPEAARCEQVLKEVFNNL